MELKAGQIVTVDWRKDPGDPELAIPDLTVVLQPSAIKTRITTATDSCVTAAELQQLRQLVVLAIGGLT